MERQPKDLQQAVAWIIQLTKRATKCDSLEDENWRIANTLEVTTKSLRLANDEIQKQTKMIRKLQDEGREWRREALWLRRQLLPDKTNQRKETNQLRILAVMEKCKV